MTIAEAATLISAVTASIVSIGSLGVAIYTAMKTSSTHTLVNGASLRLEAMHEALGVATGHAEEIANPTRIPAGG